MKNHFEKDGCAPLFVQSWACKSCIQYNCALLKIEGLYSCNKSFIIAFSFVFIARQAQLGQVSKTFEFRAFSRFMGNGYSPDMSASFEFVELTGLSVFTNK